ncbi:glutaredoxin family protein [Microbacterium sediminicola]|uniref:Glutaredoxin family protein n=1 Tax=Microbacterium sediminicola TaxID=415210 RepID=A0ABP4U7D4_9MICO
MGTDDHGHELTLIGRDGCHLCDVARGVIDLVLAELPDEFADDIHLTEISADSSPELHDLWTEKVPVILIDGAVHSHWRVDAQRLREALLDTSAQKRSAS